jgi:phosphonate metabolism protein (transferase hexapeptide repeat family)
MQDPDTAGKRLGPTPSIHATAHVRHSTLGAFTEIGARTRVAECRLGDYSYVVNDSDLAYATLGRFCSIASHVRINPGNHPLDRAALNHFTYRSSAYGMGADDPAIFDWRRGSPVTLGHDVWVGHGAIILPGVTVGTGAAIGAGAVVTKDVPDFAVMAGNPARLLRFRCDEATRAAMLRLAWGAWDHARLAAALPDVRTLGLAEFCARHG